jgi:hypothetical protein
MTTVYKGITVPDLTDPPNSPAQMRALVDSGGAVPRFATLADARAAYPPGQRPVGMIVSIGGIFYTSDGTDFVQPIQGGGVPVYDTIAARDAAQPNPSIGNLCVVKDFPWSVLMFGTFVGTGQNKWIGTINAGIQVTSNGVGEVIVNFPTRPSGPVPFSAAPLVSGLVDLNSGGAWVVTYGITPGYPNGAGFIMGCRNSHDTTTSVRANTVCKVNYFAAGPVG